MWLCEEHRDGYRVKQTEPDTPNSPPSSSREYSPRISNPSRYQPPNLNNVYNEQPTLPTSPVSPVSPVETIFVPPEEEDCNKSYMNIDPLHQLEYVRKILCEVIENADASRRKHFRNDDIREIAQKMRGHVNNFRLECLTLYDDIQKVQFISILDNQIHLYIHFLRSIVRYRIGKFFFFLSLKNN